MLQGAGFECVGLDASAKTPLDAWTPPHRVVAVVGNETHGLSADTISLLDGSFSIPMAGDVESLNVAVAASLVCYRLFRGGAEVADREA